MPRRLSAILGATLVVRMLSGELIVGDGLALKFHRLVSVHHSADYLAAFGTKLQLC